MRNHLSRSAALAVALLMLAGAARASSLLLVSVDGLRPDDVIQAERRGVRLPTLKALMADGAYADGVRNELPTLTIPNHATLVTGVAPAVHGIWANQPFDPLRERPGHYYWYAADLRAATLWDVVHADGGVVASINWPVSVGAESIDLNIPEYWRDHDAEDLKALRAFSTPGLPARLEARAGVRLADAVQDTPDGDEALSRLAAALYATRPPRLFTLHLASLDMAEHMAGPGSPAAKAALERTDADLARVIAAGRAAEPDLIVAVVSDHGFAPVSHDINILGAFVEAGLITRDPASGRLTGWQAAPWGAASAAVYLKDPADSAVKARVAALLKRLAADPRFGIQRIADEAEIARLGGDPRASFWIDFMPGFEMGQNAGAPLDSPSPFKGTHGYFPDHPEMRASLFIAGPGVPKGRALGEVDMIDVAPTLARLLGVAMPGAQGKPLF